MPELLSLKDRLKLFEKEIEDQHKEPEPKKDRKFSFLSEDEVTKMKEEEAKRIASMTAMSMEAFESLTSQVSTDDQILTQQIEDLEKYDTSAPSNTEESAPLPAQEEKAEQQSEMVADIVTDPTDPSMTEAEKRAAWRKARLQSLEDDALQAQMVIERMSELTTAESQDSKSESDRRVSTWNGNFVFSVWTEDNATYRHSVDTQGNITETEQDNEQETDSEMTTSEDLTTGRYSWPAKINNSGSVRSFGSQQMLL